MTNKNLLLVLLIAFTLPVFAQSADMTLIPYRKGDLWGYASADRTVIINPEYDEANLFYEGFAVVKKAGKYGYVSMNGKLAIPAKFLSAKPFRVGYFEVPANAKKDSTVVNGQKTVLFAGASLSADGYEICINTKGEKMPKCPAIHEDNAPDLNKTNTITVVSNYSTIQKSDLFDKITDDYKMPGAEDSYYIAMRNNNYGVFNNKFEVIVPFEYTKIEKLKIGAMVYLLAEKAGLKGLLFGNGSPYMPVENTRLVSLQAIDGKHYFIFTKDGKTGIRDTRYKNVVEAVYTDIVYDAAGGFILSVGEKAKGFCFLNYTILDPQFAEIKTIKGGNYILAKTHQGKWSYVSNNSAMFFED